MNQSSGPAVSLRGVTKTFGAHTAVNNLSLTVPRGTVYGFIGPNGSGKTTTLRMIMRILHPDSGEVEVLGEHTTLAASDRVGYLPEERGLYKSMTVRDVLKFYAALKGLRRSRPAVDDWIERMGLTEWAGKKVQALSKGMSQKVQFIAAVVAKPELVLLDEPFSGLDPVNLEVIRDAVLDLRRQGMTVIFSTHDMNVAERMCDSIFMIYRGNKVLDGTLDSIQATYGSDTLRVRLNGDGRVPAHLPGVQKLTDFGRYQELRLADGVDSQSVLAAVMAHGRVLHFELARPSLQDIFVRIAAPEADGGDHV
ncbi:MAG TPA: ATP-binding cassette domain-containing protein [Planctomycetaceae bacterium]|jgi:ABC-2 type transport system ATP-binding protein|nr:ATP-binding cassette domain-containing protein [Planctomycetaceae bacterium]